MDINVTDLPIVFDAFVRSIQKKNINWQGNLLLLTDRGFQPQILRIKKVQE